MNPKTAYILRWIAVLPVHFLLPGLLVGPIIFYNTPFIFPDHPYEPFYNLSGILFRVVAFLGAITIAPSHKRIVFWLLFAFWTSLGIYSCWSKINEGYSYYITVQYVLQAGAVLLLFGLLNKTDFRIWPIHWKYRVLLLTSVGIIFSLASFSLKISEWYHGQKFKALPAQVYHALCKVDEFRFSPCKQLDHCPLEIKKWDTMNPTPSGEYNQSNAALYFFKFRGGIGYCIIAYKNTPGHDLADVFWLNNEGHCIPLSSSRTTSSEHYDYWREKEKLPDVVYDELCDFELENNSKCTQLNEFPESVSDWHPNYQIFLIEDFNTNDVTQYYFLNGNNEYLLVWHEERPSGYSHAHRLWVNSNEVWNPVSYYLEKYDN